MNADLPPGAYAAALAELPGMHLQRLSSLLRHHEPEAAWRVVCGDEAGRGAIVAVLAGPVGARWRRADRMLPEAAWERCRRHDITVLLPGDPQWPNLLSHDPLPPPLLFARGDASLLRGRRVSVVGTRNATRPGLDFARRLGGDLAASGAHVVSGLARGIDGAAHRGALAAEAEGRPIAVVGSGLDVVYPREHADLWRAVANCGLLLGEAPPGALPAPWRFPLRNRIVAALAEVVVVVESREKGGSLITVTAALERGIPVMAVPGRPGTRAADGVNQLLRDGAAVAADAGDVLAMLGLHHRPADVPTELRPRPRPGDDLVLAALEGEARTIDGVALAAAMPLVEAAMALARLEAAGWVAQADGWYECVGSPLR